MRISFGSVEDFRKECIDRTIHEVRRDYMVETKIAESSNARIGKVGITRFKVIVTATDGMDILRWEHSFYSCLDVMVNEERTKKDVEERTLKIEEQLHKDFPPEYAYEVEGIHYTYNFALKKGIIEEV